MARLRNLAIGTPSSPTSTIPCSPKARVARKPLSIGDACSGLPSYARSMALHAQNMLAHAREHMQEHRSSCKDEVRREEAHGRLMLNDEEHASAEDMNEQLYEPPQFCVAEQPQHQHAYQEARSDDENEQHVLFPSLHSSCASSHSPSMHDPKPQSPDNVHALPAAATEQLQHLNPLYTSSGMPSLSSSAVPRVLPTASVSLQLGLGHSANAGAARMHVTLERVDSETNHGEPTGARTYLVTKATGVPTPEDDDDAGPHQDSDPDHAGARTYLVVKTTGMPRRASGEDASARPSNKGPRRDSGINKATSRLTLEIPQTGNEEQARVREGSPFECEIAPVEDVPPTPAHHDNLPGFRNSQLARAASVRMSLPPGQEVVRSTPHNAFRSPFLARDNLPMGFSRGRDSIRGRRSSTLTTGAGLGTSTPSVVTLADIGCTPM